MFIVVGLVAGLIGFAVGPWFWVFFIPVMLLFTGIQIGVRLRRPPPRTYPLPGVPVMGRQMAAESVLMSPVPATMAPGPPAYHGSHRKLQPGRHRA